MRVFAPPSLPQIPYRLDIDDEWCHADTEMDNRQMRDEVDLQASTKAPYVRAATGRFSRVFTVNDKFLDRIGEPQAWLIGLLAADGNIKGDRLISFSQSGHDGLALVEVVRHLLSYSGVIYSYKNAHAITITSARLVERLAEFGVVPRKSLIYRFPTRIPAEHIAAFMRGYIDGDGSVGIYTTTTTTYLVISFVGTPEFLRYCQLVIPTGSRWQIIRRARNLAEIRFNGRNAVAFGKWLWANPLLPRWRKQAIWEHFSQTFEPQYMRYERLRERARKLFDAGERVPVIAARLSLRFQTIYKWRKKWLTSQT